MLTAFDVGFGILVLVSAILAAARGLTREILSLATWAGSAVIAAYAYFYHRNLAEQYIQEEWVAAIATVAVSFLVSLIILHLLTMRIADLVTDSRIGPVDRVLGFIFGAARGVLIGIVGVLFLQWLVQPSLPPWAANSRSLPVLESMGESVIGMLPEDAETWINEILTRGAGGIDPTGTGEGEGEPSAADTVPDGQPETPPNDAAPADAAPLEPPPPPPI